MASSSATPQTSGTKSFLTDPMGVCNDVFESVCDVGTKFEVGSAHWKTLVEHAKKLNAARKLDWSGFSGVKEGYRTTMDTAVSKIAGAAGQLETLLANNNAAVDLPKIALQVKLIKANVNVLENTARLAQLKPRPTLKGMGIREGAYTSKPDNEGDQKMWKKARFKEEIEELVIDASSCGDRFDQGPHQRDNGPGPTN